MNSLDSQSIDLIYSDILYGTGRNFIDYQDIKSDRKTVEDFYYPRIREMYRLLKETGSIYLQMDYRISHYVRLILEDVFGYDNFVNEIVWCYVNGSNSTKHFTRKHDTIYLYVKDINKYVFNVQYRDYSDKSKQNYKSGGKSIGINYKLNSVGVPLSDWWHDIGDCSKYNEGHIDRLVYATQKPLSLMNRIIKASSKENDLIADFFCGSGSFGVAGKKLNRNIILCDINQKAIDLAAKRLSNIINNSDLIQF